MNKQDSRPLMNNDFRPLSELDHFEYVEFQLFNGREVVGRRIKGIVTPSSITFVDTNSDLIRADSITGWRETVFNRV